MTFHAQVFVAAMSGSLLIACAGPASASVPAAGAMAVGAKTVPLAGGLLSALPSGALFIRVVEFQQPPGTVFPSVKHVPGLIFQGEGSQLLAIQDKPTVTIGAGQGFFLGPFAHTHTNPGPTANHWYFLALWPSSAKSSPLPSSSGHVSYQTPDFPLSSFPPGSYIETLRSLSLDAGGRTGAAQYGGLQTLFVVEGSITVRAAGNPTRTLSAGEGTYEAPGTATQVFNPGRRRTMFLAFYVTAAGQPFSIPLDRSP